MDRARRRGSIAHARVLLPGLMVLALPGVVAAAPSRSAHHFPTKAERGHPPVVVSVGPAVGPHAIGNEECRSEESRCETAGTFFGLGVTAEVRARLYRILYAHVRPWIVSNVATRGPIYRGVVGGGVGLGVYGHHVFARGEYDIVHAFGDNRFTPPFFDAKTADDTWGNHSGMLAVGFRKQVATRWGVELWGGPMFGPKSVRRLPDGDTQRRTLTTFMLGLTVSFDALADRKASAR